MHSENQAASTIEDPLLSPVELGDLSLPNRVVMAPLTRSRASQPGDVPTDMNATYYRQRASAGLIISEATQVSPYCLVTAIHPPLGPVENGAKG